MRHSRAIEDRIDSLNDPDQIEDHDFPSPNLHESELSR